MGLSHVFLCTFRSAVVPRAPLCGQRFLGRFARVEKLAAITVRYRTACGTILHNICIYQLQSISPYHVWLDRRWKSSSVFWHNRRRRIYRSNRFRSSFWHYLTAAQTWGWVWTLLYIGGRLGNIFFKIHLLPKRESFLKIVKIVHSLCGNILTLHK